jgi:HK97 family phage prohead protease
MMGKSSVAPGKLSFDFPLDIKKQTETEGEFHIVGYAATTDFDLQGDVITEDALRASQLDLLNNSTVLLNHDIEKPIGKVTKAEFDKNGLLINMLISQTEPDIIQKIKEGILNKFSIRGQVLEREKKFMPEYNRVVNVINKMVLVEVSLVSVPANPEARAIGWYMKKALDEIDSLKEGGDPMSKKENQPEDPKPEDKKPEETPAPQDSQPENPEPAPAPEPEPAPAPSDAQPEKVAGKTKPKKEKEAAKENDVVAKLESVWPMLDRLISLGGDTQPMAIEIKSALKEAVGQAWTPPAALPPSAPTITKEEIAELVAAEIKKHIEPLLKQIPAQRKGVIQPEPEINDIKKTFEGLPPEKKLRVALALQQG